MVNLISVIGGKIRMMTSGAKYTGEKIPGDLDSWSILDSDPNKFLQGTYDDVSRKSMTLFHTAAPVIGAIEKFTDYAVGDGLSFRSQPDYSVIGMSEEEAEEWAKTFEKEVFREMKRLNFFQKQTILFRTALAGGDGLLFFLRDGNELDLIELPGSIIDANKNESDINGELVTMGIIHDRFYRRLGFYDQDGNKTYFAENGRQNAVQFNIKLLARQLRGYPLAYSAISNAKNDDRFNDATLASAIIESMIVGFTDSSDPEAVEEQIKNAASLSRSRGSGLLKKMMQSLGSVRNLSPGNILNFRSGGKMQTVDKKTPSNTYGMFKEWNTNYMGMHLRIPPEVMMSKYNTSYTAHKGAKNDFKRAYLRMRANFADTVCQPVLREITINLILSGIIKAPGFFNSRRFQDAYLSGKWYGPTDGFINPLQETNAVIKSIDNGLALRSDELFNDSGLDYETYMSRWEAEQERFYRARNKNEQQQKVVVDE